MEAPHGEEGLRQPRPRREAPRRRRRGAGAVNEINASAAPRAPSRSRRASPSFRAPRGRRAARAAARCATGRAREDAVAAPPRPAPPAAPRRGATASRASGSSAARGTRRSYSRRARRRARTSCCGRSMPWLARGPGLRRRWRAGTWPSAANVVALPPRPSPPRSRFARRRALVFGGDVPACLVPFGHVFCLARAGSVREEATADLDSQRPPNCAAMRTRQQLNQ